MQQSREPGRIDEGRTILRRGVMKWCHEPAPAALRRKAPSEDVHEEVAPMLVRAACWMIGTTGFRLSVMWEDGSVMPCAVNG